MAKNQSTGGAITPLAPPGYVSGIDYRRLNWFDVSSIMNSHKLIVPLKAGKTKIICYVNYLLLVNYRTSSKVQHEIIMLFLSLCVQC